MESVGYKKQSGDFIPNKKDGLLVWIDVSELGTVSRHRNTVKSVLDKAPGGVKYSSWDTPNRPKISQRRKFNQSVLKFENDKHRLTGMYEHTHNVKTYAVINDKLELNWKPLLTNIALEISFDTPTVLNELLIFEEPVSAFTEDLIIEYLCEKWNVDYQS